MADPKDNEANSASATSAAEKAAAGKSAAVKPPVLEATARPADKPGSSPKPQPAARGTGGPTRPSVDPKSAVPPKPSERGSVNPVLVALGGAILGLGGAYALAWFGLWPTPAPAAPDARLSQWSSTIPELEAANRTAQDELVGLDRRIVTMEETIAAMGDIAPADTTFSDELAALAQRVEALASSPESGETTAQFAAEIEALRQQSQEMAEQVSAAERQLQSLGAQLALGTATEADRAQLPLILSGFEAAFAGGRPYDAELAALRRSFPELTVPERIASGAMTGLPRPDAIASALNTVLPNMLAGRPPAADGDWQATTLDWLGGVIALRPSEPVEGAGPDATIARLEAAVARRDFATANAELASLPDPMRQAAGAVADDIAAQAEAAAFLSSLRMRALSGEEAP